MEQSAVPHSSPPLPRVQVSQSVVHIASEADFVYRGEILLKGKGQVPVYLLQPEHASSPRTMPPPSPLHAGTSRTDPVTPRSLEPPAAPEAPSATVSDAIYLVEVP